ncbi:MAG: methyltransferase domain-containing protein [Candidatus Heimdallarchaeota archaeon]|nr:methyltransferase domain-containing protein [Candidatus Heimdallarchaeota archaeon]
MNSKKPFKILKESEVYPPSEDSWFFADVLLEEVRGLSFSKVYFICEIGTGTGYISAKLLSHFADIRILGIDLSWSAVKSTRECFGKYAASRSDLICGNLLCPLNSRKAVFDIIFFNPPYVRTDIHEYKSPSTELVRTWAGGPDGTFMIRDFLTKLLEFRFEIAYFLSSSLNDNDKLIADFPLLDFDLIAERHVADETLIIYGIHSK